MQWSTISIAQLNQLDHEGFTRALGTIFEHSPWVPFESWSQRPFESITDLHKALCATMMSASLERKLALICAHPDLAGKAAIAGELTAESSREQSSAGLDRLTAEEYALFTRHNNTYRKHFAFPFIICVREHTKESILNQFAERLSHDREDEINTALGEIAKIANLRLRDMLEE